MIVDQLPCTVRSLGKRIGQIGSQLSETRDFEPFQHLHPLADGMRNFNSQAQVRSMHCEGMLLRGGMSLLVSSTVVPLPNSHSRTKLANATCAGLTRYSSKKSRSVGPFQKQTLSQMHGLRGVHEVPVLFQIITGPVAPPKQPVPRVSQNSWGEVYTPLPRR